MKYVKMLGLAAVAAAALMAFIGAGTASANVVCSATENPCAAANKWANQVLDFSLTGGTASLIDKTTGDTTDTCTGGTVKGNFTQGTTISNVGDPILHVTELTWTGCTFPTTTTEKGTLKISKIAGTSNGTVTGSNFKVTINTIFFGSCVYGTGEHLDLGTLGENKPPVFKAAVHVPFISGGGLCPHTAEWNAEYKLTSPSTTTGSVSTS